LILSYSRKAISGWTNHSGIVISQNMIENEMDNRGSKSIVCENTIVKEQRVDGYRYIQQSAYIFKVYSKRLRKKFSYNCIIKIPTIHHWTV